VLFVLLFVAGILVLPVMFDVHKHGANNIFRRSGRDLLEYEVVQTSLRGLHISMKRLSAATVGVVGLGFSFFVIVIIVSLLRFATSVLSTFLSN
jgi:hypothetical protein